MSQEKINKLEKAISSPNTPKEFIPDLKKRKSELEREEEAKEKKREEDRKEAEKAAQDKLAKQRKQLKSCGDICNVKRPVKKQVTVVKRKKVTSSDLPGRAKDQKYFNPEEKWEVKYAKASGRKKLRYNKGGKLSSTNKDYRLVRLTLSDGEDIQIAQAAYLTDTDIKKRYKVGDKFDTFDRGMQTIEKVEIVYGEGGKVYERGGKMDSYKEGGKTGRCPTGTQVQTLLFNKKHFSETEAKAWAKRNDYHSEVDVKPETYRIRQAPPFKFKKGSFKTIQFEPGLEAVIACPK